MPRLDRVAVLVFAGSHGVTRARRLGLPGRGDGADGGQFRGRRRGHQPAGARRRRPAQGRAAGDRRADGRLHRSGGDGRAGLPRRRGDRLRRCRGGHRPALPGRDGDRQHHRRRSHRGSLVRRAGRCLGRARHRRRRQRARSQGCRRRCRAGAPRGGARRSPAGRCCARRSRAGRHARRHPFGAVAQACRCCSTASWSPRRSHRSPRSIRPRSTTCRPRMSRPRRRIGACSTCSACRRCSTSACASARRRAHALPSTSSARPCLLRRHGELRRGGRFGQRGPLRTSPVRWRTNAQRKDNCSISAFLPLWALERARGGPAQGVDVQAGRAALTVRSRGLAA